ncbi:MAG: phage portal protein [Acidobacteriales bacterium]|nr:phage portal protein [Terriglobales bacterium]
MLPILQRASRVMQRWMGSSPTRTATPAYNSTGTGHAVAGWNPGDTAINALIAGGGDSLRRQSRDMARRNAWARNAIDSYVANSVGAGIIPQPKHPDPKVKEQLQQLWLRWTDEADASGLTDFYGLQALACRTSIEAGECFARKRPRLASDGLTVPLQIQLLEPEYLPLTDVSGGGGKVPAGNQVRWGIEFDKIGRRAAYHFYREHPCETPLFFGGLQQTRVPADSVMHLFKPLRPGQHRGETWMAPVLLALHELEKYDRATLVKQAISTMVVFFESDQSGEMGTPAFGRDDESDSSGMPLQGLQPGAYVQVPHGRTVDHSKPPDVGTMYVDFMRVQLRKIAAGLGLTYEQLTGDLTGVNYSSIRAGLLEFRRRCEAFQHQVMVFQFCRPVWRAWIEAAALAGVIDARDYAKNPAYYLDVEWQPQAWDWVDPLKDAEAEILLIDNLLKSRSQAIKGMGYDAESVDRMIAEDQAREDKAKLRRGGKPAASPTREANQKEQFGGTQ